MRFVILCFLLIVSKLSLLAQDRCAQVTYEKMIHPRSREAQFEKWISDKAIQLKSTSTGRTQAGTYVIPVVVHVIHNGEAIGTGTNISDAQIQSQIDVLNKDYQRLNADASNTLAEFQSVAGSMDIQFVLAKQDPEGLASTGIVRVKGTKSGWKLAEAGIFKSLSYWRADHYLNIWVINFDDPGGYIGYAQLPVPSGTTLQGLEDASTDSLTDGVTIHYETFGSSDYGSFSLDSRYDKGRTATHEIGHFLGLRHIWGDGSSCSATDYVEDTPTQDAATRTCPTTTQQSCGHSKMFQNYLDYTDDACMNLFTVKQVERMDIVINNCMRRKSLITSPGGSVPVAMVNDLGTKSIVTPQAFSCYGEITPSVEVKNYGSNNATACRIQFKVNGTLTETKDFTLSLNPLASTTLSFSPITLSPSSTQTVSFEIVSVNGSADPKTANNVLQQTAITPAATALPITESFNTVPANWIIQNPDGLKTWEGVSLSSNKAMRINLYDYENEGTQDRIITPAFSLANATSALLSFDYAYAQFPGEADDSLSVLVITDCGASLSHATTIFSKNGSTLATTTATSNSFTPTSSSQWKTITLSLLPFLGHDKVQIAFVARNGYGNNIYLDNVSILNETINDLGITTIVSPGPVICMNQIQPVIKIKNQGSTTINSFTLETVLNGIASSLPITGLSLLPGEDKELTLNALVLSGGTNKVTFNISSPNGAADNVMDNNSLSLTVSVNSSADIIPLRENFDSGFSAWTIVSQDNALNWQTTTTPDYSTSLVYKAFDNTLTGQQSWLVSPVLDFSETSEAGLFFNLSYGTRTTGTEQLQLFASTDGGLTYPTLIYDIQASEFSSGASSVSWLPKTSSDWQKDFINLNSMAGKENVRLAFVVTNQNGNNLYLDNFNFYTSDNSNPAQVSSPYYIYANSSNHDAYAITFNLTARSDVRLDIYNLMGQKIAEHVLPNTLNQTYPIDFSGRSAGVYIIKTQIGNEVKGTKIVVNQ